MSHDTSRPTPVAPPRTDPLADAVTGREVLRALKANKCDPEQLQKQGLLRVDHSGRIYVRNGADQWVRAGQLKKKPRRT